MTSKKEKKMKRMRTERKREGRKSIVRRNKKEEKRLGRQGLCSPDNIMGSCPASTWIRPQPQLTNEDLGESQQTSPHS